MIVASSFTMFASTVYNMAIATTNTELIANAVIILFITDIDEMTYALLTTINPRWADSEEIEEGGDASQEMKEELKSLVEDKIKTLKTEWEQDMKTQVKTQVQAEVEKMRSQLKTEFNAELEKCHQIINGKAPVVKAAQDNVANMAVHSSNLPT